MSVTTPRATLLALGLTACLGVFAVATPASAAEYERPRSCSCPADSRPDDALATVDGFEIGSLPDGLGGRVSDFDYEWEDVVFASKVWERGPDSSGGFSVDLDIKTLRGERLTDRGALRDYLAEYYERDPKKWDLTAYDFHGKPGFVAANQAFWLHRSGLAVSVKIDRDRFDRFDLLRTACSIQRNVDVSLRTATQPRL